MTKSNSIFNTTILVVGLFLVVSLTYAGCNSATTSTKENTHIQEHTEKVEESTNTSSSISPQEVDAQIDLAVENIDKGTETGDMALVMNEGIMKLLTIVREDPDNERANYFLGIFAIQSGQLEKAEKRFEKIVLLQPENQEYKNKLAEIRQQLGK